jgi:RNA polymerase sigma-70 factor (ECF subfamily)
MAEISETGFERLCEPQRRPLLAYLYTLSGDYHLAEDLVQESLTIAHGKREHYFPEADFGAWLRAIARNVYMRERRAEARRPAPAEIIDDLADQAFTAEAYASERWEREREALRSCLGELREDDRGLVRDHFSGGKRYAQLAEAAGRTVSWVKVRMFRARRSLADCVRRRLGLAGERQ